MSKMTLHKKLAVFWFFKTDTLASLWADMVCQYYTGLSCMDRQHIFATETD